jgi:hypothetical protein
MNEVPTCNCEICKFRVDEFCKRKRKNVAQIDQPNCIHYSESLYHRFTKFYNEEWVDRGVYQTTDFVGIFGISRHLARHYLYEIFTLNEHKLFRYKKHNKSYYIKQSLDYTLPDYPNSKTVVDAITQAEQFKKDGLKIRIDK